MWSPGGRRERLKSLLAAARRPKKIMWRWGGKLVDFSFQEAGQERPGASRRACRRAFLKFRFWERPGDQQSVTFDVFSNVFVGVFGRGGVGFLLASALAGAKAKVEKLKKTIGFYFVICVCVLCARMAQTKAQGTRKNN